ncbi:MAG TPA: nucleotidyltransferase domain-containing protein [Stellaceae bacterium]|nr:nucleotidyltransferase domain-containing protein [Stellaceae bacterium]
MPAASIDMTPEQRRIVEEILRAGLPQGSAVWVFGSRATGRARHYSDLDLVIDAERRLTLDETGQLADAFTDSDLPYRVDIVDWQAVGEGFRKSIAADRLSLIDKSQAVMNTKE